MLELVRSEDGTFGDQAWLKTFYTFSLTGTEDPEHLNLGPLKVVNQDRVKPGQRYPVQERRDVEMLTYVVRGELGHRDSLGNDVVLPAGSLQCISAGTGVSHCDFNPSTTQEAHLVHVFIDPASAGLAPSYAQKHFPRDDKHELLRVIGSPDGESESVIVHQDIRVSCGIFHQAQRVSLDLSKNRRAFLHVMRGSIAVNETRLNAGDGVKMTPPGDFLLQHGRDGYVIVFDLPAAVIAPPAAGKRRSQAAAPAKEAPPAENSQ